ncbi:hypothetical protein FACS1894181_04540 [Bacteroidia bacterium]|nr:hypothetical protein FACS1894181_04540 [Bacteroidia bacterium]
MKRIFFVLLFVPFSILQTYSQDCDSFYQNALVELRKQNASSIQTAIKLLESAKRCYYLVNDVESARRCDDRIAECNAAITQLSRRNTRTYTPPKETPSYENSYIYVSFEVSKENLEFTAKSGKDTIQITGNTVWSLPSLRGWYRATRNGDDEVIVTVDENRSSEPRSAYFSISYSANRQQMIRINQEGIEPTLSLSERSVSFPPDMNWEKKVTVTSNTEWEIADAPYWCKALKEGDKLILTPEVNDEDIARTGVVTIAAGTKRETLAVKQESDYLRVEPNNYTFTRAGGRQEFRVAYTGEASIPFAVSSDNPGWCKVSKPDENHIIVQCLPNKSNTERTNSIRIFRKGTETVLSILQEGKK